MPVSWINRSETLFFFIGCILYIVVSLFDSMVILVSIRRIKRPNEYEINRREKEDVMIGFIFFDHKKKLQRERGWERIKKVREEE